MRAVLTSLVKTTWLVVFLATALAACEASLPVAVDRPNVVLVVTDDQSLASLRGSPIAMPWLTDRLEEPGWTTFTNAVVSTPMCCPSRATILTGRYARSTGVLTNGDGDRLDEDATLATWLHDAGYRTALVGKYLNGYPWDRGPYVPAGWDRWFAKLNVTQSTTYVGYDVVDDGRRYTVGDEPEDYATDRLAREAVGFVREAPRDRPWFLYFAPSAPHFPWTPAPRHAGLLGGDPIGGHAGDPAAERATLRAVDEALAAIWETVAARGELGRTALLFVSDNGFSYGSHGVVGKGCPWRACLEVPYVAYVPGTAGGQRDALVANVDLAPTIAEFAEVPAPVADGLSLLGLLRDGGVGLERDGVLIEWAGPDPPGWVGVRMPAAVYVRTDAGEVRLFRLRSDPLELANVADDPAAQGLRSRAEGILAGSLAAVGGDG